MRLSLEKFQAIESRIAAERIIAVVTIDNASHAEPLANTLFQAGVGAIELTLRTDCALDCLRAVKKAVPEMLLCAGTVLKAEQVGQVVEIGVDFAVAPGCNPRVLQAAAKAGLFFGPGIATASEMEIAFENGCSILKYFPAETSGGLRHLKILASPFLHLTPRFIPLGGLTAENFAAYLNDPLIIAIGGSWIAPRDLISRKDWKSIGDNARTAVTKLASISDAS